MSLDSTITISVDAANDGNPVAENFSRHDDQTYPNRTDYIAPASHSLTARDVLSFYRTRPKKSANFLGMAKSAFKFTRDLTVAGADGGDVAAPFIVTVEVSMPVGTTAADLVKARQRAVALLDDDAIMDKLNSQMEI